MSYDPDVDEGRTILHQQQLKNDERNNINDRHRKTRSHLLQQAQQNGNLLRENVDLEKQNKALAEKVEQLEEQLENVSALARTKFTKSAALLQTIRHLRDAWKVENQTSPNRQAVDDNLNQYYKNAFEKSTTDLELQKDIGNEIEQAKAIRPKRPIRRMR